MKRSSKKKGVSQEWLTTWSDLVTLLMCFFVLLFALSSTDSAKYEALVAAFNPEGYAAWLNAKEDETSLFDMIPEELDFDAIAVLIRQKVEELGLQDQVRVEGGDGFALIMFRDAVFFDPNRSEIKPLGRDVLDAFSEVVAPYDSQIGGLRVLGHTAKVSDVLVDKRFDRSLSSNRATEVAVYIQEKEVVQAKKIIPEGLGEFYPIASNDTEEGRIKNRRVEILVSRVGSVQLSLDNVYAELGIIE